MRINLHITLLLSVITFSFLQIPTNGIGVEKTCKHWKDMDEKHVFCNYANYLNVQKIVSGYSDGTFRPDANITRGEFAKIIQNAFRIPEDTSGGDFPDVPSTNSFYSNIKSLKNAGIITGYSDGTFKPNENISRGAATKFLVESARYRDIDDKFVSHEEGRFPDVQDDYVFANYINLLDKTSQTLDADKKIISGYSDGRFKPEEFITRGQAAKITTGAIKLLELENVECDNYYCDLEVSLENYLFSLINASRSSEGKPALSRDSRVDQVAKNWSKQMYLKDEFEHNKKLSRDIDALGIEWRSNGENIGYSKMTGLGDNYYWQAVEDIHKEMFNEVPPEDGHRQNILSDTFTYLGVGIYVVESGKVNSMWTTEDYYKEL